MSTDETPEKAERRAWLDHHEFANADLALAMACLRPAEPGELARETTVIAVQSKRGVIALYWAPVLTRPDAFGRDDPVDPGKRREKRPRILGVVDLERLAKLDPSAVGNRFGLWRGKGRGAKGPAEQSDPERDAARDRLKGRER